MTQAVMQIARIMSLFMIHGLPSGYLDLIITHTVKGYIGSL